MKIVAHPHQVANQPQDFPHATWLSQRTVSIPLSPRLSDGDVEDVIGAVRLLVG